VQRDCIADGSTHVVKVNINTCAPLVMSAWLGYTKATHTPQLTLGSSLGYGFIEIDLLVVERLIEA